MSRRAIGNGSNSVSSTSATRIVPTPLETEETVPLALSSTPVTDTNIVVGAASASSTKAVDGVAAVSIESQVWSSSALTRVKHWKESAFATALTEPTWEAERDRQNWPNQPPTKARGRRMARVVGKGARTLGNSVSDDDDQEGNDDDMYDDAVHPDTTGCLCCSALVCPYLGAGRVGNMAVLWSSTEWVEEVDEDLETGERKVRRYTRPKLSCVVGPYWPMLVFVTYPLILAVSGWAFYIAILPGRKPVMVVLGWLMLTTGLIVALALTGCRDPGILYRHESPPPQFENSWRWSDQTKTYRPRGAHFDSDTAVIVEEFDHTCPWTGTAIGKKNMLSFQFFVCLVFVCLIVDIFLITGAL